LGCAAFVLGFVFCVGAGLTTMYPLRTIVAKIMFFFFFLTQKSNKLACRQARKVKAREKSLKIDR